MTWMGGEDRSGAARVGSSHSRRYSARVRRLLPAGVWRLGKRCNKLSLYSKSQIQQGEGEGRLYRFVVCSDFGGGQW